MEIFKRNPNTNPNQHGIPDRKTTLNDVNQHHDGCHKSSIDKIGHEACNQSSIRHPKGGDDIPKHKTLISITKHLTRPDSILALINSIFNSEQRNPCYKNYKGDRRWWKSKTKQYARECS